jgi:NADPH:quinone reductase-like Zn-dependent oxidoreductase
MKAAAFYEYGPAEAMQYADIPDPVSGPGDVLVQVQACGVNHSDLDSRAGTSRWPFELPMILGAEFTGTVVDAGDRAGSIHPGDLVTELQQYSCGRCAQCAKWRPDLCAAFEIFGTTRGAATRSWSTCRPRSWCRSTRATTRLPMASGRYVVSTAWHMVNQLALVRPGDLVLVPSASGGVAGALVQCAKLTDATVVATVGAAAKAGRHRAGPGPGHRPGRGRHRHRPDAGHGRPPLRCRAGYRGRPAVRGPSVRAARGGDARHLRRTQARWSRST